MVQAGVCSQVASASEQFINDFVEGRDTVGMVTFQSTANVDFAPAQTFKTAINTLLSQMQCTGYTTTAEALYKAYVQLQNLNQPSALNVIVMFTDGIPDSFVGTFTPKTYSDTRYDSFNYSTNEQMPPTAVPASASYSGCLPTDTLTGVITDTSGQAGTTGYTGGIYPDTPTAISYQSPYILPASVITAPGCAFTNPSNYPTYSVSVRQDIPYLPQTDYYGSSLTGYKPLDYYPAGSPYANMARIDTPNSVMNAATNAANNMANTIRNSGYYIYTIGLGGTSYQPIDTDLLMRIANDPLLPSSEYNSSQPTGHFVYTTASGIAQAFSEVESLMLHLSQ
jgi:von Willebrand factor type A domain